MLAWMVGINPHHAYPHGSEQVKDNEDPTGIQVLRRGELRNNFSRGKRLWQRRYLRCYLYLIGTFPQYNPGQYMPGLEGYAVPPVAGDFLESLGKELGLEVPLDQPYAEKHCGCWSGYSYCK
ncbi:hypothetical protein Tco_1297469, partial [Tanacetum coccineum]